MKPTEQLLRDARNVVATWEDKTLSVVSVERAINKLKEALAATSQQADGLSAVVKDSLTTVDTAAPLPAQPQGQGAPAATFNPFLRAMQEAEEWWKSDDQVKLLKELFNRAETLTEEVNRIEAALGLNTAPPSQAPEPAHIPDVGKMVAPAQQEAADAQILDNRPETRANAQFTPAPDHIGDVNEMIRAAPQAAVPSELIAELDWCIAEGNVGPRSRRLLVNLRAALASPVVSDSEIDTLIMRVCDTVHTWGRGEKYGQSELEKRTAANKAVDALKAYIAHALSRAAPVVAEGCVMVPKVPTPEMLEAAIRNTPLGEDEHGGPAYMLTTEAESCYRAFIAASQESAQSIKEE